MKRNFLVRCISFILTILCCCGCLFSCVNEDTDDLSESENTTDVGSANDTSGANDKTSGGDDSDNEDPDADKKGDTTPVIKVDTPLLDEIVANTKHKLSFREDGSFTVLTLPDVQWKEINSTTANQIKTLVDREDPDLVIFTGDNCRFTYMITEETFRDYVADMVEYIERKQIPWCHVFGNHDSEQTISKEIQQKVYESFDYCVSSAGPEDINGIGNYVLPVYSSDGSKIQSAVWCLDSGMYTHDGIDAVDYQGGTVTDYIRQNQVDWYKAVSAELTAQNGGVPVYGMMAFHIPLQENLTAWNNREILDLEWTGEKRENVCCSTYHSTLFEAIKECGDVKAIVNAHDHINDYAVKYQGVWLAASGRATDQGATYFNSDMIGGRVVVLNEKNTENVTTYMSYIPER